MLLLLKSYGESMFFSDYFISLLHKFTCNTSTMMKKMLFCLMAVMGVLTLSA